MTHVISYHVYWYSKYIYIYSRCLLQLFMITIFPLIANSVALRHVQSCLADRETPGTSGSRGPRRRHPFHLEMAALKDRSQRAQFGLFSQSFPQKILEEQNWQVDLNKLNKKSNNSSCVDHSNSQKLTNMKWWCNSGLCSSSQLGPRTTLANDSLPGKLLLCTSSIGK